MKGGYINIFSKDFRDWISPGYKSAEYRIGVFDLNTLWKIENPVILPGAVGSFDHYYKFITHNIVEYIILHISETFTANSRVLAEKIIQGTYESIDNSVHCYFIQDGYSLDTQLKLNKEDKTKATGDHLIIDEDMKCTGSINASNKVFNKDENSSVEDNYVFYLE